MKDSSNEQDATNRKPIRERFSAWLRQRCAALSGRQLKIILLTYFLLQGGYLLYLGWSLFDHSGRQATQALPKPTILFPLDTNQKNKTVRP